MAIITILGSSYAISDETHENTHLVVTVNDRMVLIDGAGNPLVRLKKAGYDPNKLTDIVITHFHPDHVSGIPLLLMGLGLAAKIKGLNIYANSHCLDLLIKTLDFYEWDSWHSFPVNFVKLNDNELNLFLETDEIKMYSSPVEHFIPTHGLRIELSKMDKVVAFSCDTRKTQSVINLSKNADILIHEAAGESVGHSSAKQAGEVATEANVKSLYLIHYPTGENRLDHLVPEAATAFDGPIKLAEDFMVLDL
jgi:ribonuclease Z